MKMNYFVFGSNDLQAALAFYEAFFEGQGMEKIHSGDRMTLWSGDGFMFGLAQPFDGNPATVGNGTMLGIGLDSEDEVRAMYDRALALGGTDEGEPGIRSGRFAAYVRDLDGNKICLFE